MGTSQPAGSGERVIRQGECVLSIAAETGHLWKTIWNHPGNADLRAERNDPNILLPGDRIHVPDIQFKTADCATDQKHTFVRSDMPGKLRIVVLDMDEPLSNQPYELVVNGISLKGTTDDEGRLEQTIPPGAKSGRLFVGQGDETLIYDLNLGAMDPLESLSGMRARLRNLGYQPGSDTAPNYDDVTAAAISEFCSDQQIPVPDDPLDPDFLQQLEKAHGF